MSWVAIAILAAAAYGFKALGLAVGAKADNRVFVAATMLIPPALFAALIMVQTFERAEALVLDARALGLVAASIAAWRKAPFVVIIAVAMIATAACRAVV